MPGLPATGELSYNGVEFVGAHNVTALQTPIYDDTGRQVKAVQVTIQVSAILAVDTGSLDSTLEDLRFRVSEAGKRLVFRNKGFGNDIVVNGREDDLDHGPKPQELSWTPVGDNLAAEIVWQVTTTRPPCKYGRRQGVRSINWSISWDINEEGDTRRILTGFIEIASREIGADTADQYRQFFAPKPIRGFRREQSWTVSQDRTRVEFSIVDTQIPTPNPYPVKIVTISGTHRVTYRPLGKNAKRTENVISATINPEAGLSRTEAWNTFLTLATQRLSWARGKDKSPFLTGIDVEEDLFGRPQSFRLSYWFLSSLSNVVDETGLWRPLGTDWGRWGLSLSGSMFNNRGNADLQDIATDDQPNNLCLAPVPIVPNNKQRVAFISPGQGRNLVNEKPKADKSWLKYKAATAPMRQRPAVLQSFLQGADNTSPGAFNPENPSVPGNDFSYGGATSTTIPDIVQVGGSSRYAVRLMGEAVRAGYPIPRPQLFTYGGTIPIEKNNVFVTSEVGDLFGVKIFAARWAIDYLVPINPGRITPLPDASELV